MCPDDFFGNDSDRTVVKPFPGGRRSRTRTANDYPPRSMPRTDHYPPSQPPLQGSTRNNLLDAASTLLSLVGQLRDTTSHADVDMLHMQVEQEIKSFESAARGGGSAAEEVSIARYLLCTLIDETVLNTPWGNESIWNEQTMLAKFYREAWGGEEFFKKLYYLKQEPGRNIDLLELIYVCLLMGFEGQYKVQDQGLSELRSIQEDLFYTIRQVRGEIERGLSPHWRGVEDRRNPLVRYVPLWVLGAVLALLLVAVFIGFRLSLNSAAEPVFQQLNEMGRNPPSTPRSPYLRATERYASPKLATLLEPEVMADLIVIDDRPDSVRLILKGDGLFRSGSVNIEQAYRELLTRIGEVLTEAPGQVMVVGHTDNVPMKSLRFSSNWDLSKKRALSVADLLARITGDKGRFRAEGLADTQPLVPNDNPAHRAQNRRVEIIVYKETGNL